MLSRVRGHSPFAVHQALLNLGASHFCLAPENNSQLNFSIKPFPSVREATAVPFAQEHIALDLNRNQQRAMVVRSIRKIDSNSSGAVPALTSVCVCVCVAPRAVEAAIVLLGSSVRLGRKILLVCEHFSLLVAVGIKGVRTVKATDTALLAAFTSALPAGTMCRGQRKTFIENRFHSAFGGQTVRKRERDRERDRGAPHTVKRLPRRVEKVSWTVL